MANALAERENNREFITYPVLRKMPNSPQTPPFVSLANNAYIASQNQAGTLCP